LDVAGGVVRLPLGFAGGLFDADTGLTRFVWRDYDADTGRFTALDPLGEKGGDNDWYGYCLDDPVNRADVWGLEDSWWDGPGGRIVRGGLSGAATGAIGGAVAGAPTGVGAPIGALVGGLAGLPSGLLKATIKEAIRSRSASNNKESEKESEPLDNLLEHSKTLQDFWWNL